MTNAIGFCRCRDREVYGLSRIQGKSDNESKDNLYRMEFIKRVRTQEAVWLQVFAWVRTWPPAGHLSCQVPGIAHTHSLTCGILCHPLKSSRKKPGTFISWMRTEWLRNHRICQSLDKFLVRPHVTFWCVRVQSPYLLSVEKELLNEKHVLGGVGFL